jgi:23S rRNA pseudouridine2605 synthase
VKAANIIVPMEERLQKILAKAGYGSQRSCEEIIDARMVRVNGAAAKIGDKGDSSKDKITIDGTAISSPTENIYIAPHKPRKVLTTVKSEPNHLLSDNPNHKFVK